MSVFSIWHVRALKAVLVLIGMVLIGATVACLRVETPSQQAQDIGAAVACVEANWGQPVTTIAATCLNGEIAVAEDVIADVEFLFEQQAAGDAGPAVIDAGTLVNPYAGDPHVASRLVMLRAAKAGAQ